MRILIAADIFPPQSGGPATYSVLLANELAKLGDEVKIISLNPYSDKKAVNCEVFPVLNKGKVLKYIHYFWLLFKHAKNAEVIYAMGPVNAGLPALLAAKLRKKKLMLKVVGDYAWEQGVQRFNVQESMDEFQKNNSYAWQVNFLRWVERMVARNSNTIIVPSRYLKSIVLSWGAVGHCIQVIYNSSHPSEVCPAEKPLNEKWIVSAGRLVSWKGMDKLIEIMPEIIIKFPEARLKIFGEGPEREDLKAKAARLKLEEFVEIPGNLARRDLLCQIAKAQMFVLNSGYEGLSHLLIEALHCGTPVLASRAGGNQELIVSGKNGELFELNNKEEIKENILKLLANNNLVWSAEEKKIFFEQFSVTAMIKNTREILQGICKH